MRWLFISSALVRVAGTERTVLMTGLPGQQLGGDISGLSNPILIIAGCTSEDIAIPLVWSPVETPTLSVRYREHHFEASWSGTEALALVEGGWSYAKDRCLTTATTVTLPTPIFVPDVLSATVSMLEQAKVISFDGAVVRVWPASDTFRNDFAPCREDDTLCWLGTDDDSGH